MANFPGGGFSTGFARGAAVAQGRQALKLREQELAEAKSQQARESLQNALSTSEETAQSFFDSQLEMIREAAPVADENQLQGLRDQAMLGPQSHALFLAKLRAQARAAGASDQELELLPSPGEYIRQREAIVDSAIQIGNLVGAADIGQEQFREGESFVTRRTVRGQAVMGEEGVMFSSPISPAQQIERGQKQFREGDEFVTRRTVGGQAVMGEQGVLFRSQISQVQQIEQGGPGAFGGRTPAQLGAATQESISTLEDAQARIIGLAQTGAAVAESPRVAGVTGFLNEQVGGVIGQVSPALASGLSMMMTGVDPERASQLRADFRIIIAENLTNITGEESGRFTEPERAIAEQTLRTIPINATGQQILGAFGTIMRLNLAAESRELMRQQSPQRFDLLSTEGNTAEIAGQQVNLDQINELDSFLIDAGIGSPAVRDSVGRYLISVQATGVVPIK